MGSCREVLLPLFSQLAEGGKAALTTLATLAKTSDRSTNRREPARVLGEDAQSRPTSLKGPEPSRDEGKNAAWGFKFAQKRANPRPNVPRYTASSKLSAHKKYKNLNNQ